MEIDLHFDNDRHEESKELIISESEDKETKGIYGLESENQSTPSDSDSNLNFEIDSIQNNSIINEVFQFDNRKCKKRNNIFSFISDFSWTYKDFAFIKLRLKNKWW